MSMHKNNLSQKDLDIIKDNYGKIPVRLIHEKYLPHLKRSTIGYEASKLGLSKPRVIYDFKWSPEMAYFIGWIASDGNLYHGKTSYTIRIALKSDDIEILHLLKRELGMGRVSCSKRQIGESTKEYALLAIHNKSLYNKLLEIGLTPNKSKILKWPRIPKEYYRDFIRGVFDGDGSISFNKANDYKGSWRAVFYSASKDFIYELKNILESEAGITSQNLSKSSPCYAYKFGKFDTVKLANYMYYDNCIKLERKYNKFTEAISVKDIDNRRGI